MASKEDVRREIFYAITECVAEDRNGVDQPDVSDVATAKRLRDALSNKGFLVSVPEHLEFAAWSMIGYAHCGSRQVGDVDEREPGSLRPEQAALPK